MKEKLTKTKEYYQKHKCKFLMIIPFLLGNGSGGMITFTEFTDNVVRVVEVIRKPVEKPAADLTEIKDQIESNEDFKKMNVPYSERTLTGIKSTRAIKPN